MTARERFHAAANFETPDSLPALEWASWWDLTLEGWRREGLDGGLPEDGAPSGWAEGDGELHERLGLDRHDQFWISALGPFCPEPPAHGAPRVADEAGYRALLPLLFPRELPEARIERAARVREERGSLLWLTLEGFFWFPRELLGIEPHLLGFYDQPELMRGMNEALADWMLETIDRFCRIAVPDFMTFAEDLSYNLGPMISRECYEEFMTPYYRRVVPELKRRGIRVIVDSDGDISSAIPWFIEAGIEGALPLERQAGVDVAALRESFPRFILIGGYDKMVMKRGEAAMRAEFERLLPTMRRGGFIPSVDHQTPPDVSLANYRIYARLLREFCEEACRRR
jgi:hypothetical protein